MDLTRFPHGLSLVDRNTAPASAGLSPRIWEDCPILGMLVDPGVGVLVQDDFTEVRATGHGYELSGDNGTFAAVASAHTGTALLSAPAGADNNEAHIAYNNDVAGCIKCCPDKKWWFEARVKLSQIAAEGGVIVGLLQQAASASDIIGDSAGANDMGLTATLDYIGFQFVEAAANAAPYWRTITQLAARAAVSETAALASTSYIKLGMKSTPNRAGTIAQVKFYVDGIQLADSTTTASYDFPLNVVLIPHFGIKTGKNAAFSITLDWWQAAQLR